jgi:hypothetical protein
MPDDEELDFAPSKRKLLNWTPLAWLNSLGHHTGFSTSENFNKEKVLRVEPRWWGTLKCQTVPC